MEKSTILLPIRSEKDDDYLIRSAVNLAKLCKAELSFLYIIETPEYKGYPPGNVAATTTIQAIKAQKDQFYEHYTATIKKYEDDLPANTSVEFNSIEGSWTSGVIRFAKEHEPGLILLHHEEKGFLEKILGESNTEIIRNVESPVWIVPKGKTLEKPEKIAYITHHTEGDMHVIRRLAKMCQSFPSTLYILHLVVFEDFESDIKKRGFNEVLRNNLDLKEVVHADIEEDKMIETIDDIIDASEIDLLAVHHQSEGFLKRFYGRSSVEKLSDMVSIPIAIYK